MSDINIALNKPATASNSVAPYTPDKAVDGQISSPYDRWLCNSVPGWINVDLGTAYWVKRWVIRHLAFLSWPLPDYANANFSLQGSNDNQSWVTIDSVSGNASSITDRSFVPTLSFRFYRVYFTKGLNTNPQMSSIAAFELYQYFSSFLTALTVSSGTLSPTFNKTTLSYTDTVPYSVNSITVTPTAENAQAIIKVNNVLVPSGSASQAIPLNVGTNTISISVTAFDGSSVTNYNIVVTRQDSALLNSLVVQSGSTPVTINPTFNKNTFTYNASVGIETSNINIIPTAESTTATITVNGTTVQSGQPSPNIPLNVGNNTITVIVNASGGLQQTYTITVNRADSAFLSSLTAQTSGTPITLTPAFSKTGLSYTASVGYNVSGMTVTPTSENPNATIKVNNTVVISGQASQNIPLSVGSNTVTILITTPGGLQQTYTINVTKADSAYLNTLVIKSGVATYTLNPGFAPQTFNYTSNAGSKNNATVTPTAQSATAVVKVNGTQITTSQPSVTVPINNGTNTITIEVTNGGFTNTYIVTITKP